MINSITENGNNNAAGLMDRVALRQSVEEIVNQTPVIDIHTHLYAPEFKKLNLYGIDELLTYHYLIAEMFRFTDITPEQFWRLNKTERAEMVWKALFVENTPLSEASTGVITILKELEVDPNTDSLGEIRDFFGSRNISDHMSRVFKLAGVSRVVMTNDPFDAEETETWENRVTLDDRFSAALRMDRILNDWENTAVKLSADSDQIDKNLNARTIDRTRHFLDGWIEIMQPLYMAVSLPDDFSYFVDDARNLLIREVVLPIARDHKLPFALMVGVRRGVNPALRAAGDGVGRGEVRSLEKLCSENPDVSFLATYLARENQHELCVSARKFSNLMPFGCWWFLNNPSIIAEITRERLELLGTSFIPQHSDARVLEQLIYKWKHSRRVIADALYDSYEKLLTAGRSVSKKEIERDVTKLFSGNFQHLLGQASSGAVTENNGRKHY
jgi:hypothetical protein